MWRFLKEMVGGQGMNDYSDMLFELREEMGEPHYVNELMKRAADAIEQLLSERETLRNELCLRCGKYKVAHMGGCLGCRWYE